MIKKALSLFPLFLLTPCLHAAFLVETEGKNDDYTQEVPFIEAQPAQHTPVYDYTLQSGANVDHVWRDYDNLKDDVRTIADSLEKPILGARLVRKVDGKEYKYLFFGGDPATEEEAAQKAHNQKFAYHIIEVKEKSPHSILDLLGWLKKKYRVKELYINCAVCKSCHLLGTKLFNVKLLTNEKGCGSNPFPSFDNIPPLSLSYINAHLTLSLVEKLIVPWMGYVSGDEARALQQTREAQSRQLNARSQELLTKEKEVNDLKSQLTSLGSALIVNNKKLSEVGDQHKRLADELTQKREEIKVYQAEVEKKDRQLGTLRINLNQKRDENEAMSHLLQKVMQEQEAQGRQLEARKKEAAALKADKSRLVKEHTVLVEEKKMEEEQYKRQLTALRSKLNELESENTVYQAQNKKLADELSLKKDENEVYLSEIDKKDEQLINLRRELDKKDKAIEEKDRQLDSLRKPWFEACKQGDLNKVKSIYQDYRADLEAKNEYGYTALMCAAMRGKKDVVEYLVKNGAEVNATDEDGGTALMEAAWQGRKDVVEVLIKKGADLEAKNKEGRTALIIAAYWGKKDVVEYLVKNGAEVNTKNKWGRTALMFAAMRGKKDVVEYLKAYGAKK